MEEQITIDESRSYSRKQLARPAVLGNQRGRVAEVGALGVCPKTSLIHRKFGNSSQGN